MKKASIIIMVIIILLLAIFFIIRLINPSEEDIDPELTTTTTKLIESELGYQEVSSEEHFISYIINKEDLSDIELTVNDINITVSSYKLMIDDDLIIEDISINRDFAIYSNKLLVLSINYNKLPKSGFILYDLYEKEYEVIDKISDMFIDDNYQLMNNGIIVNLKLVEDQLFLTDKDTKDLCKLEISNETIVKVSMVYLYDINEKRFINTEEVSSISYESYIASNNLCS